MEVPGRGGKGFAAARGHTRDQLRSQALGSRAGRAQPAGLVRAGSVSTRELAAAPGPAAPVGWRAAAGEHQQSTASCAYRAAAQGGSASFVHSSGL